MKIVDIEMSEQFVDINAGMSVAQVTFHTDQNSQTHFTCLLRSEDVNAQPAPNQRLMFVRDALRQLRRMPEFRSGRDAITFGRRLLGAHEGLAA
ncbi:hypothetical protein [Shimia sp. SDUM112013]|uniref:hypothetical protein n=1 Tax=Shimia sp. SDUM112013 TaxID=3136160 RepID=UPI0032ED0D28